MLRTFRYESQGQRQRFESHEHRSTEQQKHPHLDVRLNVRRQQRRFPSLSTIHLTSILAALLGATCIIFWWISLLRENDWAITWPSSIALPWYILLAGLTIAWGAIALGGLALLVSAWHPMWLRFASKLRFVMVGALALLLFGGVLWVFILSLVQLAPRDFPWSGLLLSLLGLCFTFLLALSSALHWPRWRERTQARPKDDLSSWES